MNQETMESFATTAERLAGAAEALERVLGKIEAQQEELGSKVDRIVAAVEENLAAQEGGRSAASESNDFETRMAELEKANTELKAQATRLARKTFSPLVTALLGKYETDGGDLDAGVLDKTLSALSVEQRIAVKAEMARAGILK
jgi:chromosome segregation ATPase